ncbi:MAG: type III secretion system chaperone [Candidatus Heimdallarchaeota archaeon]|nr:type III secretion system chaperone [Candidatus Heimdallarchaeota archaeon]
MTQDTTLEKPVMSKIREYLEKFQWNPVEIKESPDTGYTITLVADLGAEENEENGSKNSEQKVFIKFSEESKWIYFSSKISIIEDGDNRELMFEKLLRLNYSTTLTKFGLAPSNSVYVMSELPLPELNYSEFTSALRRIVNDVNRYKKQLLNGS